MRVSSYINTKEIRQQTREIILSTSKEFNIGEIVKDLQKVYPSNRTTQDSVLKEVCKELATMVKDGLVEVISLEDGIYKTYSW